jgi:hypothetical protein
MSNVMSGKKSIGFVPIIESHKIREHILFNIIFYEIIGKHSGKGVWDKSAVSYQNMFLLIKVKGKIVDLRIS